MREIKFRAWAKYGEMLSNVQNHIGNDEWAFGNMLRSDDFKVMQYTGLKDKNGKEIYESDIIVTPHFTDAAGRRHKLKHFVKWSDKYHAWLLLNCDSMDEKDGSVQMFVMTSSTNDIEVIGNLYENPELMSA